MFSIRSKVSSTPIPSYASFIDDTASSNSHQSHSKPNRSRTKKRRKKKRKASEIVNINDYPSAKRLMRRISIVGVDVDPKKTKEIIQNKDFLLCEYHSNFPQFLVNQLKSIPKHELNQSVCMKSCDNQWIITKVNPQPPSPNAPLLIYWNTSSTADHTHMRGQINPDTLNSNHHPNSPAKCYMIELNKCIIYDPHQHFNEDTPSNRDTITPIADMQHIHLLYPCASALSTLKPHRPFTPTTESHLPSPHNPNKYHNPFMPYALNKNQDTAEDTNALDDSIICPLFPSSTSRSMTSIAGIVFLSEDHRTLYAIPHDHVTAIAHETDSEHITYGTNRNITYKIPLLTDTAHYNERITTTQILPQPRVGSHHQMNTYKILMGTTHGRLFYITLIINKNTVISKPSDVYFDHGTDLSAKVMIRDHELLFAFSNENHDTNNHPHHREETNGENVGWLGFVVSKIKLGANALSSVSGAMDEHAQRIQILRESGQRYDTDLGIASIAFGLNENCTKVIGYTLRKESIECIEFTEKDYRLLWSHSLRECVDEREETLCVSLLGQGLSVLSGYIDGGYGHCLVVRLFKINSDPNALSPLTLYGQCPVQLPSHIRVHDLHKLRYESFWSYYNDRKDGNVNSTHHTMTSRQSSAQMEEDEQPQGNGMPRLRSLGDPLQRQTSMAEFVEQRQDLKNEMIQCQHHLVAPFGMLWSTDRTLHEECDPFIAVFPLLSMQSDGADEIWERLYSDYSDLYDGMQLNNTCGPDGDHFSNGLVTTFELRTNHNSSTIPFYGGGCMLLPYEFGNGWRPQPQRERNEDEEKQIVEDESETRDGGMSARQRKEMRQLSGGGYGYFMNEKYQIMRIKYSLQCAMARIHPDIEHYQQQQREEQAKKMKMMIRLAFSEFRNGNEGQPRANRLSRTLLSEKHNVLSLNVCRLSESILDLKLFDTFCASDVIQSSIQSVGFNTNKMRLGISQMDIKLQTYADYIRFLKESPSAADDDNLWCFIENAQKCDIVEHREYLEIARHLYHYFTNSKEENDHYGMMRKEEEDRMDACDEDEEEDGDEDDEDGYEEAEEEEDDMDGTHTTDSRSSLSNCGDSNHSLYRQKYFALKKGFIPKLLQSIIRKRGDIEYIHTFGNDEYDTFFMKIAQIKEIWTELPTFLETWLSHLTYKCFDNKGNAMAASSSAFNEDIALSMKALAQYDDIKIENERDELVHQLITIRIALEVVQCMINTANEYRMKHGALYSEIFDKCRRIAWNYSNRIRCIAMRVCRVIVPYMKKIAPLLSSTSTHTRPDMAVNAVIDTDNNYYDYILRKERSEIYRSMNEMSRMIMESYRKELHLLQHEYQDRKGYETVNQQFAHDRSYLVKHLYDLFPSSKSTNYERWKTDLVKDAVHKIAFDFGDCEYLVKLCDATQMATCTAPAMYHNVLSVCHKRFIDNFKKYEYKFMRFYFAQHQHNIDAFLCIDIQQSDIWKQASDTEVVKMKRLLNKCISHYITESMRDTNALSIMNEYSWIHNLSIGDYANTASQLYHNNNNHNQHNLDQQTVHLSMAKLSVFAATNEKDVDVEKVEEELLWLNAKGLLRSLSQSAPNMDTMGKREIVQQLMKESLRSQHEKRYFNFLQHMEEILSLIFNLESESNVSDHRLNDECLIVMFVEYVIDCNRNEWQLLNDMYEPEDRVMDNSMLQIINRTVVYKITKYLYDKKNQAQFIEQQQNSDRREDSTTPIMIEDHLWQLWCGAINYCTTNKKDAKYYFTVRALSFAQSNDNTF